VAFDGTGTKLLCDVSTGRLRHIVPVGWRWHVFEAIHVLSHPGRKPSKCLVVAKFVWRGLKKDVRD